MKYFSVEQFDLKYFENAIPTYIMKDITEKRCKLFGAMEEDGNQLVGCMVCTLQTEEIQLEWLFVDPRYRRRGYGTHLLAYGIKMLQEDALVTNISCVYDDRELPAELKGFFHDLLFLESEEKIPIWRFEDADILIPEKAVERLDDREIYSLDELSKAEKREYCQTIGEPGILGDYDDDISLIRLKNKKAVGAVLCRRVGSEIELAWMSVEKDEPLTFLSLIVELRHRIQRSHKGKKISYIVSAITPTSKALLFKIVPNARQIIAKKASLPV